MLKLINLKISFNHAMTNIKRILKIWKKSNEIVHEFKLPNRIIVEKRYMTLYDFNRQMIWMEPCVDYIDSCYNFGNDFCDEVTIIFISDLKDITLFHFMEQPKSMLCRKLERSFVDKNFENFEYNWLPKCFISKKMNYINDYCY